MGQKHRFTNSNLPRARWNVLDMITFVAIKAVRGYLLEDIDMTWAESLRAELAKRGQRITVTAILLKAIGIAQRNHPASRTMFLPFARRAVFEQIAAGFTVEKMIDHDPAVFFGTLDAPDEKSLVEISEELSAYAERPVMDVPRLAKETRFTNLPWLLRRLILWVGLQIPAVRLEVNQATFALTSLGKFGITQALGPCACTSTFGVGSVENRVVVRDGAIVAKPIMTLGLIVDLRVLDLDPAARFLKDVRHLLEGGLAEYLPPLPVENALQSVH